jgi:diadenosine tetraphosphate (Ap4A) HIT family hydrolase
MSPTSPGDCVFCEIVAGRAPVSRVHEDDQVLAFLDLHPVNPGHTLVIPRSHVVALDDLDVEVGTALWRTARQVAAALPHSGVRCDGVNLFLADGEAAGQEVPHVHLHVFPRFSGDAFRLHADWHAADRALLDDTAHRLATAQASLNR